MARSYKNDKNREIKMLKLTNKAGDKVSFTGDMKEIIAETQKDFSHKPQKRYTGIGRGELFRRHDQMCHDPFREKDIHEQIQTSTPENFWKDIGIEEEHSTMQSIVPVAPTWIKYNGGVPDYTFGGTNNTTTSLPGPSSSGYSYVTKNSINGPNSSSAYTQFKYNEEDFPSLG